jgi:hypothetical protein
LGKYYIKVEKKSLPYINFFIKFFFRINISAPLLLLIIKLLNKLIIKRNWFAQKIYYILLKNNLAFDIRKIISINYRVKKTLGKRRY